MFFVALSFIFAILFFYHHNYFYLALMIAALFLLFKRNKKEIFILGIVLLFIFSIFRFNYFSVSNLEIKENKFMVIQDCSKYVIVENNNNKFIYYDDNTLKEGNVIEIEGKIVPLEYDNEFNKYLKSNKVFYKIEGKVVSNNEYVNLNIRIIDELLKNKDINNSNVLRLILFNQKDDTNSEFYSYFTIFSLNFLIVISGFHINLIFKLLEKTKIFKYLFIGFYLYLLNLSIPSLKSFIYYVLKKINKKTELLLNNVDILSLILIAMLFVNPSYCFNLGFIYTFTFSFAIDLINNIIITNKLKDKFTKKLLIFFISVPLILLTNYEINIVSFLLTIIFELPISILFIFSMVYLFFDKFYLLYKLYINLIKCSLSFLSTTFPSLIFGKPSFVVVTLLYLSIFAFLYFYENKMKNKSYLSIFIYCLILLVQYSLPLIDSREIVYFLDVGQGDCSILKIKNSKSVVLIDTGGSTYKDIANDNIIPFLKEKGINVVEKVIISHDDMDHNGALNDLKANFNVKKVIDDSNVESVMIGDNEFINLNINDSRDNDGSIVLYGKYGGINYLFTGDISSEIENKIMDEYKLDVDVLKVSHHGSYSSSNEKFIANIKPEISLIGVGKNNIYNHPSRSVIDILESVNSKIYRTDINGNITIYKSKLKDEIIIEKEKDK